MAQGVENQCSIVLFLLMSVTAVHGTRYNLTETCEDQHGADLNENFALNQQATQSSTSNNGAAGRLVDGNRNPYFGNDSCSETALGSSSWEVDLGTTIYVTSVTITTRADDYWRKVNKFSITVLNGVENSLCASGMFQHVGETTTYVCEKVGKGTLVRIAVNGNRQLSLCEVEVHGHPMDFYENKVNYALSQPAKMSTPALGAHGASNAVDGVRHVNLASFSCFHTIYGRGDWWSVDLGVLVNVYAVAITNRADANIASRSRDFEIRVGENWQPTKNPTCTGNQPLESGETRAIFCSRPMRGNNVGIIQKMADALNLCEVSVHGREVRSITSNEPVCLKPRPLGMEDNTILDSQLTASSEYHETEGVGQSRLNSILSAGAWCAIKDADPKPWMQVGFLWPAAVTEILTQGRHSVNNQWVTDFGISSSNDFVRYESYKYGISGATVFPGNADSDTVVRHRLQPVRVVRIIRIHILGFNDWPSMRVEFVGCYYKDKGFPLPRALGMQSKEITDDLIDSSTELAALYGKNRARLMDGVAWIPTNEDTDPWIQVNFVLTVTIIEILTQGRSLYSQWTRNYMVDFAQEADYFQFYLTENNQKKLFPGNTDRNTIVRNALSPAIRAQFIRIYPKEFNVHRATRLEFIGYYKDQKPGPLGLEDRRIQDGQLSASTENLGNHGPHDGRLHNERAWAAAAGDQWLQVDFLRLVKVTEIWTQGRTDSDPDEWIKSYDVKYSLNAVDFTAFTSYVWTTAANKDGYSVVRKPILPPFEARAIRITVINFQTGISLRIEVIGYYITCAASCYARPLGMESGEISDTQITASSIFDYYHRPGGARLNFQTLNNEIFHWSALGTDHSAWLQVAFYQTVNIIEVQTQARFSNQLFYNYTLSYGNNGVDFESYEEDDMIKIYQGNDDPSTIVSHYLWPVITSRFIRINALSCGAITCALRVEFIGTYEVIHGPELIDPEFVEFENTLTASSSRDWNHQPHHGIISNHFHPRAWSPVKEERWQYIQVDLLQLTVISGVGFRLAGDRIHDHYTKLVLWYGDTEESLKFLRDHNGNMTLFDTRECYTALEKRLLTRHVRFEVDSWETRPDFRFQLYGTTVYSEATADVESGSIKDDQMKSSNHPNDPYPAHEGRVNGPRAWCGNPSRNKLYLQIDFLWNFEVHGVATQGKPVGIMEYTTEYKISSTMDGISWDLYKEDQTVKMFTGNTNCRCTRKNPVQPFLARALRFLPTAWKGTPCMRVEVFGVYKGILRIHARSGVLKGANETVVTRKCSIKLNGQEVSRKMPGYNVVVANPKTGALISSGSAENPSDVNDLLMNVTDDSIVVVATQNVTQRPSNETLHLLESLGAISLRYSLTSEDLMFLLVGYKGDERVNWIKEKMGTSKDNIVRVAVPIKLNENEMKPAVNQYFVNSNNINDTEITLSGDNAYIFHNITGKCGENDTDCEMGLSLSMWMKQEPLDYVENVESAPTSGRIDLQYYSQGYNYIVIKDAKTWKNAHRYCLGIGATLPIYHDKQSRDYLVSLANRLALGPFYLGLLLHPHTMKYTEWLDGSPTATLKWADTYEPSGLPEECIEETLSGLNDISCDSPYPHKVICQQPIEAVLGSDIFPLGMESKHIPDASITVSSELMAQVTPRHFGRLNRNGLPWCALKTDMEPFVQVDLARLTLVCAVATQGRGFDLKYIQYPTAFWVQLSNDSVNWATLMHHDKRKYFHGNHDNFGTVINRFPQPEIAQIVRINIEQRNGGKLCMRIELFGCKTGKDKNEQKVNALLPAKAITDETPKTCLDVLMRGKTTSGVYMIDPDGRGAFPAVCDQETDRGGWTVFQHRFDGSVDFNRIWDEYKWGFGGGYGEHWLGLEYVSRLTHAFVMDLRVDLAAFDTSRQFSIYHRFNVGDEANNYMMNFSKHAGSGSDSLTTHTYKGFETKHKNFGDEPQDKKGAWWYGDNVKSNLNGKYFNQQENINDSIFWHSWKQYKTLKTVRMMIREGVSHSGSALGLKDYYIEDYQMTASSTSSHDTGPATHARLDHSSFWGIRWTGPYLSVNLISPRRITHISTQCGSNAYYVKKFSVKFKTVNGTIIDYKENGEKRIFEGNNQESKTNLNAIISNCFNEPVEATEIQIRPTDCVWQGCSLRMELYACENFCSAPVGIQSDLPLDRISTSASTTPLENIRLFTTTPCWRADTTHAHNEYYIEVKLLELFKVTAIATQGASTEENCYVQSYYLMYVNERMKWVTYGGRKPKILPGNTNSHSIVKTELDEPFLANTVRLVRKTNYRKVCLKLEVYGCYPDNPSFIVHTDTVKLGEQQLQIKGKYRYCPNCDKCPGCIKSLCLRVFDKKYLVSSYFAYDCIYHDFDITVQPSVMPGRHRVHLIESEYGNCHVTESEQGSSERIVGSINVKKEPSNCLELLFAGNTESGKYFIDPDGKGSFEVYCDQSLYGGGWTVMQTRASTKENFDRPWSDYKSGFGDLEEDFWLGNDYTHRLTTQKQQLLIELKAVAQNDVAFVLYKSFQVSNEDDGYRLHIAEYEPSPAGNCMERYSGVKFTTYDSDHDTKSDGNCAHGSNSGFGWWFKQCTWCKLNGKPQTGIEQLKQLNYYMWENKNELQQVKMKVRDRETVFCNDHYCYYLLKSWNSWLEASRQCKRFHSDLVSIRDATENEWIRNEILVKLGIDKVHIGLKNTTWTDGGTFDFHNFPTDVDNDLCPILSRDGSWHYKDCRLKSRILCKRSKWCFKGKCHVYGYTKLSLSNAKKYCDDIGYKIPKIRNEDENNYVEKVNRASTDDSRWRNVFIGLTLDSLRQPYWYDGKKVRYTAWKAGEPNESSKQCGRIWSDGWADAICSGSFSVYPFCEKVYKEHPLDCLDLLLSGATTSGIYTIDPDGLGAVQVYCDQETFGGGWTILLRRVDDTQSFRKSWNDYKEGFGHLERGFWLGNDYNHRLTKIEQDVLFDLKSENSDNGFALYKTFQVAGEEDKYNLTIQGYQTSNIGDAMEGNNLMAFTTYDEENDLNPDKNCAVERLGGWWFNDCSLSSLTGNHSSTDIGKISWKTWTSNERITGAEMKIRTSSVVTCNDQFCYYLRRAKKTWTEALQECRNFNADLVSIHSEDEWQFIVDKIIAPQSIESVHLGLTASNFWTDGSSAATFSKLATTLTDTKCSSIMLSGDWIMNDCSENKAVLCKRGKHCHKGDCYFVGSPMTFSAATAYCKKSEYKVVKVSNEDEKEYVIKLIRESTTDNSFPQSHLGLVLSDDDRVWPDGTMLRYNDWFGNEPNGAPSETGTLPVWKAPIIRNCNEVNQRYDRSDSGIYIYDGKNQKTFPVYCELGTKDGSWLVFQRHIYQTVLDFGSHSWTSYRDGFGTKESNFWLGNKYIHELTWDNPHRLKIIIYTDDFYMYEAIYEDFYLSSEATGFVINFGAYSGNAGDALSRHRGMPFSAEGDDRTVSGCTTDYPGGWWFENCLDSNLNGAFTSSSNSEGTVFWRTIKTKIVKTEMKIQPYPEGSRVKATQMQTISLSLTSKQDWIEINLQTASQRWTAHVPHPGPIMTHVSVTWEESSYLRYYENGILVAEVPAMIDERPGYPYTSMSVFVNLPYLWAHQMKLYNEAMTSLDVYSQYDLTEITFDDDAELRWTFNKTSNYTWEPRQTCTPSNQTGSCGDHTYHRNTGTFMTTEASRPAYAMDVAIMESPTFLDHYKCLSFWYHLYGRRMGTLSVYTTDSSEKRVLLTQVSGDVGNQWRMMQVDLDDDDLDITGVFKIIIEAKRGEGFQSDVAVDDISLTSEKCKLECVPPCEVGMKCDVKSLQCVYDGIYDHLWTMDTLPPTDDKNAFSDDSSIAHSVKGIPGVIDQAIEQRGGSSSLARFSDQCFVGTCFPIYTLSFWLKYEEISETYRSLLVFAPRFSISTKNDDALKNHLYVWSYVALRRCEFEVFAPAEIWTHLIFVVKDENFTVYLNGHEVENTTLQCTLLSQGPGSVINTKLGGSNGGNTKTFAIDDLRLLFDAFPVDDTLEYYKTITGYNQTIWFKANLTTIAWQEELSDDESDVFRSMSQFVSNKVNATLGERSFINDVNVRKFMKQSITVAEIDIVYHSVSYYDILLLEEAIYVNNTLDDLQVNGLEIDSNSVPNNGPENQLAVVGLNDTSLSVSWSPIFPANVNGVFQGYKILYTETENASYTEYVSKTKYANYTEEIIDGLEPLTNYTLRVLAFSLSGDGLLSDPVIASTLDGIPTESPNMTVANISSTSIYINWTLLPISTDDYMQLLGYKMSYWKESEEYKEFNMTFPPNVSEILFENLEKWTVYCFRIAGFTMADSGPNGTECFRTLEDVPEHPPSNVSAKQVTTSSIELEWSPPPEVPGILRYYNISYRVLNISDSEVVELTAPSKRTSYSIEGLTGLMLCEINITAFTIGAGPSQTIRVLTHEGVPLAAPNISLVNISSTSIDMKWTALPWDLHNGILLGYRTWISKVETGIGAVQTPTLQTFSPNEFYKHMMNMSKWTTYCAQVAAFTAVGNGPESVKECTRTFEDAPEEAPRNFTAVEVNISSIKVEWEPPPAASIPGVFRLYNFTYRNLNYTNENLTVREIEHSHDSLVLERLRGLTLYEIKITAITVLPGPWRTLFVLTKEGVPVTPPPNIIWHNVSSTSIKSTWKPIPPHLHNGIVIGYNMSFWKQSDPQNVTNVTVSEEVKMFEDLEKWTIYCGQVAAFTKIGEGPRSQVECIRTSEDEPEVSPSSLNGTNTTWTSFYLTWDPIDPEFIPGILRSYRVTYEIQDPGFHHAYDGSFSVDSHGTSVNLTGLIGLTNYKITVSGTTVEDGPVVEVYLKTKEGVPTSPPEEITPTEVTTTTIALSWKDIFLPERHGLVKGYRMTYKKLERRSKRETEGKTLTFDADTHTAFLFKLDPYTNYSVTVAGFTSQGMGPEKYFLIRTEEGAPGVAPKGLYGVNFTGPTTIFMGWGSLSTSELQGRLAGYEVKYREFSVADEILENPGPELTKFIPSDVNGVRLTGLETYTTYQVRVAAASGGGRGVFTGILYIATCRCHKRLTTNYWNFQPYTNISSGQNSDRGFFPYLLDMVTLSCCQNCLEHGTSEVDYFHDGLGNNPEKDSDIDVKRNLTLETDYSFPVYGYNGQATYSKYYGFASIVDIVGTVFFTLKPDYSVTQGKVLLASVMSIVPFLAIAVIFAYIAGVIMWALECGHNEDEYPSRFFTGAASGFWWAYITMTTVGYGDKTARTIAGRVFAIIWVLTGLCICSLLIGTISSAFTSSTTPPDSKDIMIYGSKVAALQDSADHRLGLRRNAKFNKDNKTYQTLDELQKVLLSGAVDGILVDAYVADARKELFSQFLITKVIDLTSSYGVVMGTDAKKLRKCFNQFWKVNAAARTNFISNNSNPVVITDLSTAEQVGQAYNPQSALYQISLYSCAVALIVLYLCGCIYEIIRRKRRSTKVNCEQDTIISCSDLRNQAALLSESINKKISDLRRKQMSEILAFSKLQRRKRQKDNDGGQTT